MWYNDINREANDHASERKKINNKNKKNVMTPFIYIPSLTTGISQHPTAQMATFVYGRNLYAWTDVIYLLHRGIGDYKNKTRRAVFVKGKNKNSDYRKVARG